MSDRFFATIPNPLELTVESVDPDGGGGLNLPVRSSANLVGYEETWFSITGAGNGDSRIKHDQTRFFHDGEITVLERPDVTAVSFTPQGRFIRMIHLARVGERGDHGVLFVSGRTREELETKSAAVLKNPSQCLEANSNGWCQGAPAKLAINLFVMVVLNGTAEDVAPGIALGQFLRRGFGSRTMITPSGLEVYRPYADRLAEAEFDPSSGAIMTLPLLGGRGSCFLHGTGNKGDRPRRPLEFFWNAEPAPARLPTAASVGTNSRSDSIGRR